MTSQRERRLHNQYVLYIEIGSIIALLVVIAAFQADWSPDQEYQVNLQDQEVVEMEEIQQTEQNTEPPPPPQPPAPVEAPNNAVIEQENIDFDASLDMNEELDVSEQPPPSDEPEQESEEEKEPEIFVAVEQSPDCGGIESLQKKVTYPEFARQTGIQGRVIVQFVVNEEGTVTNPKILQGAHTLLNEEAIRAVQQLECTAGKQRGTPVKVRMTMPVSFRLKSRPQ
jgi:protein TonB